MRITRCISRRFITNQSRYQNLILTKGAIDVWVHDLYLAILISHPYLEDTLQNLFTQLPGWISKLQELDFILVGIKLVFF